MGTPLRWHEKTDAYRWAAENEYLISNEEIAWVRWSDGLSIYDALRKNPKVTVRDVALRTYLATFPDGSTIYDYAASYSVGWGLEGTPEAAAAELEREGYTL